MKKLIVNIILSLISFAFSSCSKVEFTGKLRKEYNLTNDKIINLQFYTSEEIILNLNKTDNSYSIIKGKLITREFENNDKVIIKKNTKGIAISTPNSQEIAIAFEHGDKFIIFGSEIDGPYKIMATEWNNNYGILPYGKNTYSVSTDSKDCHILIKNIKLRKFSDKTKVVKGRSIN